MNEGENVKTKHKNAKEKDSDNESEYKSKVQSSKNRNIRKNNPDTIKDQNKRTDSKNIKPKSRLVAINEE